MLQQTTTATVKGYFEKFITRWPTVQTLAAAEQSEVLSAWAGLGYYARARNMHKCARIIACDMDGTFPCSADKLKKLPGIGDYTSAAIAAIAYGENIAVVDANVERVISRIARIETPFPTAKPQVKAIIDELLPAKRAGDFAQAMMDVGATICTPRTPKCTICPVKTFCQAFKSGDTEKYPVKALKKPKPTRHIVSFAIICDGQILLERRPDKGLLGGTLGLPSTPWEVRDDFPGDNELKNHAPIEAPWQSAGQAPRHSFTHFHLETNVVRASLPEMTEIPKHEWHRNNSQLAESLPTVFRKMLDVL